MNARESEARLITPEQIAALLDQTTESMELSARSLEGLVAFRKRCDADGTAYPAAIHNAFEFTVHLYFDVSCLTADMIGRPADLRAGLYARLAILTIYEATLTLQSMLGREFQDEVIAQCGEQRLIEVRSAHKALQKVFDLTRIRFGDVRQGLAGHRDADPDVRLALIAKATPRNVSDLLIEFLTANLELVRFFWFYSERFKSADV